MANTIFNDTFTEASSDTDLPSHTPDTGTSWTDQWHTATTCKLTAIAASDTAKAANTVANSGVMYSANATYSTADYEVSCKIVAGFTGSNRGYLLLRFQDTLNMYALRFTTGATVTRMYKNVAGTWTGLGSFLTDPAVGDTIKFRVSGTTLTWYKNGVLQDTQTATDISAAGKAGWAMGGGANLAASSDDILNTNEIDNFLVQDLTSSAFIAAPPVMVKQAVNRASTY
jgi:hypothetical protein